MTSQSLELSQISLLEVPMGAFRERKWVTWSLLLADLAALEFSLVLAYFFRLALLPWLPVYL